MWAQLKNQSYLDLETGTTLTARNMSNPVDNVIFARVNGGINQVIMDGYDSVEDAQAALNELMVDASVLRAQPPNQPEEAARVEED